VVSLPHILSGISGPLFSKIHYIAHSQAHTHRVEEILDDYHLVKAEVAKDVEAVEVTNNRKVVAGKLTEEPETETTQESEAESIDQAAQQLLAALDYNGLNLDEVCN
jgi:hypothetical protein